mmetsp:Transcript_22084/g.62801  ORF Transcript_22084/g.62801 Transcript_22084/m.62801 type:complete len:359 (-) Transcript_22084:830-1906(-)
MRFISTDCISAAVHNWTSSFDKRSVMTPPRLTASPRSASVRPNDSRSLRISATVPSTLERRPANSPPPPPVEGHPSSSSRSPATSERQRSSSVLQRVCASRRWANSSAVLLEPLAAAASRASSLSEQRVSIPPGRSSSEVSWPPVSPQPQLSVPVDCPELVCSMAVSNRREFWSMSARIASNSAETRPTMEPTSSWLECESRSARSSLLSRSDRLPKLLSSGARRSPRAESCARTPPSALLCRACASRRSPSSLPRCFAASSCSACVSLSTSSSTVCRSTRPTMCWRLALSVDTSRVCFACASLIFPTSLAAFCSASSCAAWALLSDRASVWSSSFRCELASLSAAISRECFSCISLM